MNREQRRHAERYAQQGYVQRIAQAWRDGIIPPHPGQVGHLLVYHDDWCNLLAGTGLCNCQPIIKYSEHAPDGAS